MLFYMSEKLGFRQWESTCTEDFQEQGFGESTWTWGKTHWEDYIMIIFMICTQS